MTRCSAVALLLVVLGTAPAQASRLDGPAPGFARERIVKVIRRLVGVVQGDLLSVPKP